MVHRVGLTLSVIAALAVVAGCGPSRGMSGPGSDSAPVKPGASPAPSVAPGPSVSMSPALALPTPWVSRTASPAQQAAAVAALAAYRGMWADLATIGQSEQGWKDPELGEYMTDKPLVDWSQTLANYAKLGQVSSGAPLIDPRVVKVDASSKPTQVEIADCFDSTKWITVSATTHRPVDSSPGVRERTEALLNLDTDGYWKATEQVFGKPGSC